MIIIIGLVIVVAAVVAGVAGVLSNGGSGHALSHPFAVFGYHVPGSTGTLFLYGIPAASGQPAPGIPAGDIRAGDVPAGASAPPD